MASEAGEHGSLSDSVACALRPADVRLSQLACGLRAQSAGHDSADAWAADSFRKYVLSVFTHSVADLTFIPLAQSSISWELLYRSSGQVFSSGYAVLSSTF